LQAAQDVDGDPIAYAKAGDPAHGTVQINADGTYLYVPAANFSGSDSFAYSVSDGKGGVNVYTVTVTVLAVNDAPVIGGASAGTTAVADSAPVTGRLTVDDPDPGESGFRPDAGSGLYGRYQIDAAGNWSYAVDRGHPAVAGLAPGVTLTDAFDVLTGDGTVQRVSILITGSGSEGRRDAGLPPDFPTTPGPFFRAAPISAYAPIVLPYVRTEMPFSETDFVLRAVAESQALRAEQAATLAGSVWRDDLQRRHDGSPTSRLDGDPALFVLPAVKRIQAELLELRARFPASGNRFAVGAESLFDDLGPFSPFAVRESAADTGREDAAPHRARPGDDAPPRAAAADLPREDAENFTSGDDGDADAGIVTVGAPSFTALLREAASRIRPLSHPEQSVDRAQ
jgi:VCBS repeat-containing protein